MLYNSNCIGEAMLFFNANLDNIYVDMYLYIIPTPGFCDKLIHLTYLQCEELLMMIQMVQQQWDTANWFEKTGLIYILYIDISFTFKSLTDGVCHLSYLYWLMGKGIAYGGLPFPGTSCPAPGVANICPIWNA